MPKATHQIESMLDTREISLLAGAEWSPRAACWMVIQVMNGTGYWLHARQPLPLEPRTTFALSPRAAGTIRASQLGSLSIICFCVDPLRFSGLTSIAEQEVFRTMAMDDAYAVRVFPPQQDISLRMESALEEQKPGCARRLQLLNIFVEMFKSELSQSVVRPASAFDAKERLLEILRNTPADDLAKLSFSNLVDATRCTPRHLSRVFREVVGMSFRQKHAAIRLGRACELLSGTEMKIVDVALESGYPSLSLFNLMFARRFRMSPGKWREKYGSAKFSAPQQRRKLKFMIS